MNIRMDYKKIFKPTIGKTALALILASFLITFLTPIAKSCPHYSPSWIITPPGASCAIGPTIPFSFVTLASHPIILYGYSLLFNLAEIFIAYSAASLLMGLPYLPKRRP